MFDNSGCEHSQHKLWNKCKSLMLKTLTCQYYVPVTSGTECSTYEELPLSFNLYFHWLPTLHYLMPIHAPTNYTQLSLQLISPLLINLPILEVLLEEIMFYETAVSLFRYWLSQKRQIWFIKNQSKIIRLFIVVVEK